MTYFQTLNRLILKELEVRADQFVESFDPLKKSVILIPGGMGSKLLQSSAPHEETEAYPDNPSFREIWISWPAILNRNLVQLEMSPSEHDWKNRPIIAAGEMNTIVKSYDETEVFFTSNGVNYTEFGYDWRRDIRAAAGYLRAFLKMIRDKVISEGYENPLPQLTLFAHSMGGLVTKLFINELIDRGENTADWFFRFVSVGTPFYGTESHIQRYYSGDKLVNILIGQASIVAKMVATMPGPYILILAPRDVLEQRYDQLGLNRYPIRDFDDRDKDVDPYDPANRTRFPVSVVDDYLYNAGDIFRQIDRSLPDNTREQIFHLRNNIKGDNIMEFLWKDIDGSTFHYSDTCPIKHNNGASDCTVPFWSARLADTPDDHVYPLDTKTKHGDLAEDPKTLKIVKMLADGDNLPDPGVFPDEDPVPEAQEGDIENLAHDLRSGTVTESELASQPKELIRGLMNRLSISA